MKLSIGMPSYNNFHEVFFTVMSLRMFHDTADVELLVVDNYGSDTIKNFIAGWMGDKVKYVRFTDRQGTAAAKNKVFEEASGEWVFCIDSHILLVAGAVARLKDFIGENPDSRDLFQGPLLHYNLISGADSFNDNWGGSMWGQWANIKEDRGVDPYEIPKMGMGLFGCRRDAWLGFSPAFTGFGGEEGYIHEKFKKAGRKTVCLPWLQWVHLFQDYAGNPVHVPRYVEDMRKNYVVGFQELGLDLAPLVENYGKDCVEKYLQRPSQQLYDTAVNTPSDINEHLPTIAGLARGKHVTEFGVRDGVSSIAWLWGRPKKLVSYDVNPCPRETVIAGMATEANIEYQFRIGDSTQVDIEPTDILFIDTLHHEKQLSAELARHADKVSVNGLIVLHDTEIFGEIGDNGGPGLNFAVRDFLSRNDNWKTLVVYKNNNGLTILQRTK